MQQRWVHPKGLDATNVIFAGRPVTRRLKKLFDEYYFTTPKHSKAPLASFVTRCLQFLLGIIDPLERMKNASQQSLQDRRVSPSPVQPGPDINPFLVITPPENRLRFSSRDTQEETSSPLAEYSKAGTEGQGTHMISRRLQVFLLTIKYVICVEVPLENAKQDISATGAAPAQIYDADNACEVFQVPDAQSEGPGIYIYLIC